MRRNHIWFGIFNYACAETIFGLEFSIAHVQKPYLVWNFQLRMRRNHIWFGIFNYACAETIFGLELSITHAQKPYLVWNFQLRMRRNHIWFGIFNYACAEIMFGVSTTEMNMSPRYAQKAYLVWNFQPRMRRNLVWGEHHRNEYVAQVCAETIFGLEFSITDAFYLFFPPHLLSWYARSNIIFEIQ
jgi:hypothetical protein